MRLTRLTEGKVSEIEPIALLGSDCTTDAETSVGGGCQVIGNAVVHGQQVTFTVDSHGVADTYGGAEVYTVTDVTPDGTSDLEHTHQPTDVGYCQAEYNHETGRYGNGTCRYDSLTYGPEGRLVAGTPPADGPGPSALYLFRAGNLDQPIAQTPENAGTFFDWDFLDATHLVAVVDAGDSGRAHLVTLDSTGTYDDLGVIGRASYDGRDTFLELLP